MRKNRSLFSPGRILVLIVVAGLIGFGTSKCRERPLKCQVMTTPAGISVCEDVK